MSTRPDWFFEQFVGQYVRVVCVDGQVIEGEVDGYTNGYDEEDGIATIMIIRQGELRDDEIASIEIVPWR